MSPSNSIANRLSKNSFARFLCVSIPKVAQCALLVGIALRAHLLSAQTDAFQVNYGSNLSAGNSVVTITNTGSAGDNLSTGNICANVYVLDPAQGLVGCCSSLLTPNGLASFSLRTDLVNNKFSLPTPSSVTIKLLASLPVGQACNAVNPGALAPGMAAWATHLYVSPSPPSNTSVIDSAFLPVSLSPGELSQLTNSCGFILGNGSGACGQGDHAIYLPVLSPPRTPAEARAIRDQFSWEKTSSVPVFTGLDPTLYYALIYVRDQSDLDSLDELRIHWDTVPLFAEERDSWIEQTGGTTPIFDEEGGGFVYAVIPGFTFNLLRDAVLCSDPQATDEVFPVVQLREIPVPEARNADGSLSYQFLATEGFQYRGLPACVDSSPDDPDAVCGSESDTLRLLTQEVPNACSEDSLSSAPGTFPSSLTLGKPRPNLGLGLGKRFKRFASRVARFAKGVEDGVRRGLARLERFFKGSVTIAVSLEARNTDPAFGGQGTVMQRAWVTNRGAPVPLSRVQVRVYQNLTYHFRIKIPAVTIPGTDYRTPNIIADTGKQNLPDLFNSLATARADERGAAGIRIVKNARAQICVSAESEAARVVNWIFLQEVCAFEVCDSATPSNCAARIPANQLNADGAFTARFSDENINILAQATEGRAYLQDVVQHTPKKAEIMVGFAADVVGKLNGDLAFTPCFGFPNARNPYGAVFGAVGQLIGRQLGNELIGPVLRRGADHASEALDEFSVAADRWAAARLAAAGTSAATAVNAAADALNTTKDRVLAAAQAAAAAAQAGADVTEAAKQFSQAQKRGASQAVIDAAAKTLNQAIADANSAAALARDAQSAAQSATDATAGLVEAAVTAASNTTAAATATLAAATASRVAADLVTATGIILAKGVTIGLSLVGKTAGELIGAVLGDLVFDIFLADVDMVLPPGPNRQSRGIVTHEYGHFTFCDMMYRTDPLKFSFAWTETIADTVGKPAYNKIAEKVGAEKLSRVGDEDAYISEAFADFFAAQVAGGVNYFAPEGSVPKGTMSWCGAGRGRCIEDNFGAGPPDPSGVGPVIPGTTELKQKSPNFQTFPNPDPIEDPFRDQIARIATILHDAFDGDPNTAGAWNMSGSILTNPVALISLDQLDPAKPNFLHEESIKLEGSGLFTTVQNWLNTELPLLAHLRETPFLAGLTQAMVNAGMPAAEICRLYELHQPNDVCPPPPVGPPPIIIP